jgi:hypothetical protein
MEIVFHVSKLQAMCSDSFHKREDKRNPSSRGLLLSLSYSKCFTNVIKQYREHRMKHLHATLSGKILSNKQDLCNLFVLKDFFTAHRGEKRGRGVCHLNVPPSYLEMYLLCTQKLLNFNVASSRAFEKIKSFPSHSCFHLRPPVPSQLPHPPIYTLFNS